MNEIYFKLYHMLLHFTSLNDCLMVNQEVECNCIATVKTFHVRCSKNIGIIIANKKKNKNKSIISLLCKLKNKPK